MFNSRNIIFIFWLVFTTVIPPAYAQLPQISSGLNYLTSSQSSTGTWDSGTAQVETTATTLSVLETYKLLNQTGSSSYITGLSWLQTQSPKSVEYVAERLSILSLLDVTSLVAEIDAMKNAWGGSGGYKINPLDTAFALQTLKTADFTDAAIINPALAYLTASQNADGGWGFYTGDTSNVYMTAVVSTTLQQFPQMSTIATAVSKATAFIIAHQHTDGGFGSSPSTVYETALAYAALAAVSNNTAALNNAVSYLTTTQSTNGSWNDDPYSTALALKALYLSENRPSPPPAPPAGGKITGIVIDAVTKQRVSGVAVAIEGNSLFNATTDATGSFTLADVPPGVQKVSFSLSGYAANSVSATVAEGTIATLGNVSMLSAYSTGTIAGTVTDPTGKPAAGVSISVTGAWVGNATTGVDGTFSFTYVTPGDVTIVAAKTGYQTVTGTGTIFARTALSFFPRLSTTQSQVTTGTLVGRVVESYWGLPLGHLPEEEGVTVKLAGGLSVEPDDRGYFAIPGLASNTYQVTIGMNGFSSQTFRAVIIPGGTTDLGTIRLDASFLMTLVGKVTDASTGAPIPGAEVIIQGKDFTGRTDFAGNYGITDIPNSGEFTVKASATGYIGKSYILGSAPWAHTMDFALSPVVTKGSLSGTVVDAATNQPLPGVSLTLVNDPAVSTTTDSTGTFTLNAIEKGPQQINLALSGYTSRILTTTVIAGAVNNVGKLTLGMTELPASIQGRVGKAGTGAPFAGVTIKTTGITPLQALTAADGTYMLDAVPPGTVTVTANALSNPEFTNARITGTLEPGGVLVFNPALALMLPGTFDLTLRTDKVLYGSGDTVGIAINLQNRQAEPIAAALHVRAIDPSGAMVYETSANVNVDADGTVDHALTFILPGSAQRGRYTILTEAYDVNGAMLGTSSIYFDVTVSQISITPTLPGIFSAGTNTISFNLTNTGTLPVSAGILGVTLKDPDGQVVSAESQTFSLGLGENKSLSYTLATSALKFGVYTLSYVQSDETKAGQGTDILLPNTVAIKAVFDNDSHHIRETANLTVTLTNTGRFNLNAGNAKVSVPDAPYAETKPVSKIPASGTALIYSLVVPESMTAGQHAALVTLTLPFGSETVQKTFLVIPESSLSLSLAKTDFTVGETITPVIANSGGVDTSVQYTLSLYDAKSSLIAEKTATEAAVIGSPLSVGLVIPTGAVDGPYTLRVQFKDHKTGIEKSITSALTISGVKAALQVQTDKQIYLSTENITGISTVANNGTAIQGGNLHLQVTTGPGAYKQRTWTTQADFQTGLRNGVDTYGVNDWMIPDDDFEAPAIDLNRWTIFGNASIKSGKAALGGPVDTGLWSRYELEGDFDIQVDFSANTTVNVLGAQLAVAANNLWAYIYNGYDGYRSAVSVNGVPLSGVTITGSYASSGRFRITRVGTTVITYYWSGSAWIEASRGTDSSLSAPVQSVLGVYYNSAYGTSAKAEFDNLKLNSGRIKTRNQTVDSVRLLPLNDNFDDGVYNRDRWDIIAPNQPMYENGGIIHFSADKRAGWNGLSLRSQVKGNFAAITKYKNFGVNPLNSFNGNYLMYAYSGPSLQDPKSNAIYVGRSSDSHRYYKEILGGLSIVNGFDALWVEIPYSSDSGSIRLKRSGNYGYEEYWDGSRWASIYTNTSFPDELTRFMFVAASHWDQPETHVDVDSFYLESGVYANTGTIKVRQDSGKANSSWRKINFTATQPIGTSIKFRTRTAETETGLTTAIWSNYITASGSAITSLSARWIEIEATLATANTNVTPLLNDLTVTYLADPGEVLWQADVPVDLVQNTQSDLNKTIGTLGVLGKLYFQGNLTSSTNQAVASAEYPFYVEQGNFQMILSPDKKIYKPGEAITISGETKNLTGVTASALGLQIKNPAGTILYTETFDLPANSSRPFSFNRIAGADGTYVFSGTVTQNGATLAEIADKYEVASPKVTVAMTAPDTAGADPFQINLTFTNSGKTDATITLAKSFDSVAETMTIPAGETRLIPYTQQITADTTYTFTITGDLVQTLTKTVAYTAPSSVSTTVITKITTDKVSYNPNEQVTLTSTLTANYYLENLSMLVTVTNSQGQAVYTNSNTIAQLHQNQATTIKKYWNVGTNPPATYLVTLQILDASGIVIAKSTCNLVISTTTKPSALLKGQINLDKQSILTGEPVIVSYSITNTGNVDLPNVGLSLQTVSISEETIYNNITDQANLGMGANYTQTNEISTQAYGAKDYLVVLKASIDGVEETIGGSYFRVEGSPSAPALIAPVDGSDVETFTPQLSVSNAADPNDDRLTYEFEVYSDSSLSNPVASGTVSETTGSTIWPVPSPLIENQLYHWRARAYDDRLYGPWMAPVSFRVNTVNDLPSAPTISSPANGTAVAVFNPILTINNASDADSPSLTYNFEVALDPDFSQLLGSEKGITSGSGTTSWTMPVSLQENTTYFWRAQADDWLTEGPWSVVSTFFVNTVNDPPSAPIITAPANNSTMTSLSLDFVAANSTDPDSSSLNYFFEADTAMTFDSTDLFRSGRVLEGAGTTAWHVEGLKDNTRYYLRVKASDGIAETWSGVTSFSANTVNDPPTTPTLANPSIGAGVGVSNPTLSVHNATDLDHDNLTYEFEVYADAAKTNLVAHAAGIAETVAITEWTVPVQLAENQTYYWHTRAFDGVVNSQWMAMASFMVNTANDAPGAPKPELPVTGSSIATVNPTLAIVNAADPDSIVLSYDFEIYAGASLVTTVTGIPQDNSGITSVNVDRALTDNTIYHWRSRASDGDSYGPWSNMANFSIHLPQTSIGATVNFDPDTLNKKSNGTWVVVHIELPSGYKPADIDIASIRLERLIPAELRPYEFGDSDKDGISDLMVKFKRSDVINVLPNGEKVPVHVSGKVGSLTFEGVDVIRVMP